MMAARVQKQLDTLRPLETGIECPEKERQAKERMILLIPELMVYYDKQRNSRANVELLGHAGSSES